MKEKVNYLVYGVIIVFIVYFGIKNFSWTPLNLIFGSQYDGTTSTVNNPVVTVIQDHVQQDEPTNNANIDNYVSALTFLDEDLSQVYALNPNAAEAEWISGYKSLLSYVDEAFLLSVDWRSSDEKYQNLLASVNETGAIFSTIIPTSAGNQVGVTFFDKGLNGSPDYYLAFEGRDTLVRTTIPSDEIIPLWNTLIAIAHNLSGCCGDS